MLFESISILHVFSWVFVVFAWVNVKTATWNLYYVIPLFYIVHMLPFHCFTVLKKRLRPECWEKDDKEVANAMVIPRVHDFCIKTFEKSFASPVSPQGMLIFGAITSAWALKLNLNS